MAFAKDFMWGAASASYQVEGAWDADGKGPSIWDVLYPGHVAHNEHGHEACDHYYRYKEDVKYMREMGIKTYRFSISWPRVMPQGVGHVNEAGLDFYRRLVDELCIAGIEPMVTLFHWDLPYALHLRGGWMNEEISDWFADYTRVVVNALSDKVRYWMTINEPQCFIGQGYESGVHAPFYRENATSLAAATRNTLLAHGKAVLAIRDCAKLPPQVGMAPTGPIYCPKDGTEQAIEEARRKTFERPLNAFDIAWFCDAPLTGVFPQAVCEHLGVEKVLSDEDMLIVHQPLDFFGFNIYHASDDGDKNYRGTTSLGCPLTASNWPINPESLYWAVRFLHQRYGLPVLITENGMANLDFVMSDGKVHDPQRIDFVRRYLRCLKQVADEGYLVLGYTYWSILDNYEWAEGYDKRFGLIHVDYQTQKRTLKDSAIWYSEVIACNGENL